MRVSPATTTKSSPATAMTVLQPPNQAHTISRPLDNRQARQGDEKAARETSRESDEPAVDDVGRPLLVPLAGTSFADGLLDLELGRHRIGDFCTFSDLRRYCDDRCACERKIPSAVHV